MGYCCDRPEQVDFGMIIEEICNYTLRKPLSTYTLVVCCGTLEVKNAKKKG